MITIEYPCSDGTPLPVTFESEEKAALRYRRELEHMPEVLPPLAVALERLGAAGGARAYQEVGLEMPSFFEPGPDACGFLYFVDDEEALPQAMLALMEGCTALRERYGSALGIWHDLCLPRVQQACDALDSAGPPVPLRELAGLQAYGLQMTMIPAYVCGHDLRQLIAVCEAIVGEEGPLLASELTQGYDNETLRADRALWLVGQAVRQSEPFVRALSSEAPAAAMRELRAAGTAPEAFAEVDHFLSEFGRRSESWDIVRPSWDEQADGFWCQLRLVASEEIPDPATAVAAAAQRREQLVAEMEHRLADQPDALGRFRRRVERVAAYVAVREERALWQLRGYGSLRHAVLRRGQLLVDSGYIDRAEDVLYLLPEEVECPPTTNLRPLVTKRRAEHERWKQVTPPEVIGGRADGSAKSASTDGVVRGVGASRGMVTGTARVITDLSEADRLEPGDVLVCVMTSPPWTPLFGIAGAIVVDSGDMLSHPAIAAREYGVPCVLGTKIATTVIPDGSTVRVDGEKGIVEVVGP